MRRARDDSGETLVEILMTIVIIGICAIAIGAGIALSIKISDVHRKQAIAGEFLHNYAETLQASPYQKCASGVPNYASGLPTPPNGGGWTITQKSIGYWNQSTSSFGPTCQSPDTLQEVTLDLANSGGLVDQSITVILRNPS